MAEPADLFDLRGRVVVVTGASAGIGRMLALGLGARGVRLVLGARRKDKLEEVAAQAGEAIAVPCDVAVDEDRARLIDAGLEAFGRIDGLVNNAGISGSGVPATRQSTEEFRHVIEVDLVAPFDLAKRCLPSFREHGKGSVVNITSTAAILTTGFKIPQAAYCAAKGGLAHLTRELAVQWGRYNVRVNAVAPGFFATEMTELMTEEGGKPAEWLAARLPIQRSAGQDDAVGIIQFLLSDASTYVTGQHIAVDGGYTVA